VMWRLSLIFPAKSLYLNLLECCVILLLSLCYSFLGHSPVQVVSWFFLFLKSRGRFFIMRSTFRTPSFVKYLLKLQKYPPRLLECEYISLTTKWVY
jgi:hypothetical protein